MFRWLYQTSLFHLQFHFSSARCCNKNLRAIRANENNFKALETYLVALRNSWEATSLSHTPKLHSLLTYALPQVRNVWWHFGGWCRENASNCRLIWIKSCELKSATNRALAEATVEDISKHWKVKQHEERSKQVAKWKFSDHDTRLSLVDRKKSLKSERDHKHIQTVTALCETELPKIVTAHEKLKIDFMNKLKNDVAGS